MTTELLRYRPCVGTASGRRTGWIKNATVNPGLGGRELRRLGNGGG
jgi:hypothetical protein